MTNQQQPTTHEIKYVSHDNSEYPDLWRGLVLVYTPLLTEDELLGLNEKISGNRH